MYIYREASKEKSLFACLENFNWWVLSVVDIYKQGLEAAEEVSVIFLWLKKNKKNKLLFFLSENVRKWD